MTDFKNASKEQIETEFMELADNMASAAADFKGRGYFQFLEARKSLYETLHRFLSTKLS